MPGPLIGSKNSTSPSGSIYVHDTGPDPWHWDVGGGGGSNVDWAVGAFTGAAGLPTSIVSDDDWAAFANAMHFKTTEAYDGGMSFTHVSARRFTGVGGGGADHFDVQSSEGSWIEGRGGSDTLVGFYSADLLDGGEGDDVLSGKQGIDRLDGGAGADTISGGFGDDTLVGGAGSDWLDVSDTFGVVVNLAAGTSVGTSNTDKISGFEHVKGGETAEAFSGDDAANNLDGGAGADTLAGGLGDDILTGGDGIDTASYAGLAKGVVASLAITVAQNTGGGGTDTLTGMENLTGTDKKDQLTGGDGDNVLAGGEGDDLLQGGLGADTLDGGGGIDTADYRGAAAGVSVDLTTGSPQPTGGAGTDVLWGIENLVGSQSDDRLTGNGGANIIDGRARNDVLSGGGGNDTILGGQGKDVLTGGVGQDTLTSGEGKDRFVFQTIGDSTTAAADLITDLTAQDRIDLSAIDANAGKSGDQKFDLVNGFTGKAGQATLDYDAVHDRTVLHMDVDGDGASDGDIVLAGDHRDFTNFAL